jgi:hypothetical protein
MMECLVSGLTWREAGERLGCPSANIAYHIRTIRGRYEQRLQQPSALATCSHSAATNPPPSRSQEAS